MKRFSALVFLFVVFAAGAPALAQEAEALQQLRQEQREALRERADDDGNRGGRRLSPEERQRLREQINEANRDFARDRAGERQRVRPQRPGKAR